MTDPINLFEGDMRLGTLAEAIMELITERGEGLPLPGIIGTLELVKVSLIEHCRDE